ncbi:LAME_0G12860g1_1 [Lachancea meyersii CBS 8951]|uniref:LAME_0G12860g1_1 n=1 Tax=Lachancea meyersii CBS 8951 TaxID=1266667 RepID=A0A1G4K9W8_9SACH|nr:LAME_0G12860g1_1 [Lachancea meyersii CBS 8951]
MSLLNEPSVDFHLKLNEQSFHIPNELLKNNVQKVQKLVERESRRLCGLFEELNFVVAGHDPSNCINKLNEIIKAVELLERKLEKRVNVEGELLKRIEYRFNYYKELEELKKNENRDGLISWYQRYTNLLIGDYLTRNNKVYDQELSLDNVDTIVRLKRKNTSPTASRSPVNAGLQFLRSQGLEHHLDYDILVTANQISKSLDVHHDLTLLVNWIKENQAYLTSKSSTLEFETRLQEYIELVKVQDYPAAIGCFQDHLIKFINTNFEELQLASGLLVFIKSFKGQRPQQTEVKNDAHNLKSKRGFCQYFFGVPSPRDPDANCRSSENESRTKASTNGDFVRYTRVLSDERWNILKRLFLQEYYSMYGISQHDPLLIYLSLGISTLKTKSCLLDRYSPAKGNDEIDKFFSIELNHSKCPVCSPEFAPIANDLPYAHHIQSNLFDNPVMLPNGNIYDSKKLKLLASKLASKKLYNLDQGQVVDPIDRNVYYEKDFVTMYPT